MNDGLTSPTDTRPTEEPLPRTTGRSTWVFVRDIVIIIVVALLVSFLIKTFLIRSFYIPSPSMEDTLMVNDRILVDELEPKLIPVHRGDVLVFADPGGWLGSADSDNHLVKRVIGLPGDHVVCCTVHGRVEVNGVALKEPFISSHVEPGDKDSNPFDVIVPPGELWMLGDNRADSKDSSLNQNLPGKGFVPIKNVVGRAFVVSWPTSQWNWLSNYPDVFGRASPSR